MFALKSVSNSVLFLVIFITFVSFTNCLYSAKRDAEENENHLLNILKYHEIIPDLVDSAPHADILEVNYGEDLEVNRGDELTPTEVREAPINMKWNSDPGLLYTLIFIDPDSPSRNIPKARSWQHWIVGNIPGDNVANGDTLTEYVGALPHKNTGLHRFVFLLFEQEGGRREFKEYILTNKDASRDKFSVREFVAKYRLGQPIAVNFFQAKFDESVPALISQLSNIE